MVGRTQSGKFSDAFGGKATSENARSFAPPQVPEAAKIGPDHFVFRLPVPPGRGGDCLKPSSRAGAVKRLGFGNIPQRGRNSPSRLIEPKVMLIAERARNRPSRSDCSRSHLARPGLELSGFAAQTDAGSLIRQFEEILFRANP